MAALAGNTRAAIFCLNRAFPEGSIFGTLSLEAVIERVRPNPEFRRKFKASLFFPP